MTRTTRRRRRQMRRTRTSRRGGRGGACVRARFRARPIGAVWAAIRAECRPSNSNRQSPNLSRPHRRGNRPCHWCCPWNTASARSDVRWQSKENETKIQRELSYIIFHTFFRGNNQQHVADPLRIDWLFVLGAAKKLYACAGGRAGGRLPLAARQTKSTPLKHPSTPHKHQLNPPSTQTTTTTPPPQT